MAISLVIFVSDLLTEFATHALVVLGALKSARTITAGALESFLDRIYNRLILIKSYLHLLSSIFFARVALGTYPTEISTKVLSFTNATVGMLCTLNI